MSERYYVAYSEVVREHLRMLAKSSKSRGRGADFLEALKQLDDRLHVYPQFGQPLTDLALEPGQLWIGVVEPFVVEYLLDELRRTVFVVKPIRLLPRSGLE